MLSFDCSTTVCSQLISRFNILGFKKSDCSGVTYFRVHAPLPQNVRNDLSLRTINLSKEQKCKVVGKELFLNLCGHIKDWRNTGRCLGLTESLLNDIYIQDPSPGMYEYNYQVFFRWERSNIPQQKTVAILAKALEVANETDALSCLLKHV